ncbi:MAG: cobyrinic acid a,c-diamide synthase [Betaproteobacteria bacterium RIFCSPLOWO2_12_FULL_67_28]|nr:MAG: cobyrinic acid a,c-diamide synthase [Betaproteobacteria bacterium RIFCSPLOWO2_12_FULL_67_28]
MHRFLVSAAHKSSGKTTLSVGLAAALARRGLATQTFKKGPDYIDPLWLSAASGRACRNLDFHVSPPAEIAAAFARHGAEVCLVEGNKGLYDGLDLQGSNSNAALAKLLGLPVLLVLDARGMTRGIAPLILGYQAFDREVRFAGVILNRLGGSRHEAKLRAVIEHYTDVPVLGAVHEDPAIGIFERHLGLVPANEAQAAAARIAAIGDAIERQVDIEKLLLATRTSEPLAAMSPKPLAARAAGIRIGVARDRAFGFYYAGDLEALEEAGAAVVPFDALQDRTLPQVDALFIGGGFPECFAAELEANRSLRGEIRTRIEAGLPAYAECGGLMYLARSISWQGKRSEMVGAIPADVVMRDRPTGRGYVVLEQTAAHPWRIGSGSEVRAHEFHYSTLENTDPNLAYAYRVKRGHGIDGERDGIVLRNVLASYTHLRAAGGCDWPARFVAFARRCRAG